MAATRNHGPARPTPQSASVRLMHTNSLCQFSSCVTVPAVPETSLNELSVTQTTNSEAFQKFTRYGAGLNKSFPGVRVTKDLGEQIQQVAANRFHPTKACPSSSSLLSRNYYLHAQDCCCIFVPIIYNSSMVVDIGGVSNYVLTCMWHAIFN